MAETGSLAELPGFLLDLLNGPGRARLASPHHGDLPEGVRNDRLFRYACCRRREGDSESLILAKLRTENVRRCRPPLEGNELERIAASAAKHPIGGADPLVTAWESICQEQHDSKVSQLFSLACHLKRARPQYPVALPQERIADLMRCDPTLVSRYRRRLVQAGKLTLVKPHIAKQMAALYDVRSE